MPVDATSSSSSTSISNPPPFDVDPPKTTDDKRAASKPLANDVAASTPAPSTLKRDVAVFAAKQQKQVDRDREAAESAGAAVLGSACAAATKVVVESAVGSVAPWAAPVAGPVAGVVVGLGCAPAGRIIGGAVYDRTHGPMLNLGMDAFAARIAEGVEAAKAERATEQGAKVASAQKDGPEAEGAKPAGPDAVCKSPSSQPEPTQSTYPMTAAKPLAAPNASIATSVSATAKN